MEKNAKNNRSTNTYTFGKNCKLSTNDFKEAFEFWWRHRDMESIGLYRKGVLIMDSDYFGGPVYLEPLTKVESDFIKNNGTKYSSADFADFAA